MTLHPRTIGLCLVLGCVSPLPQLRATQPPVPKGTTPDADMEAQARAAMASKDTALRRETLKRLLAHKFRGSKAKEKEYCLFATGMLQAETGDFTAAGATLKKLEKGWPESPYLLEAQVVLAQEALEHKRPKDGEARLRKAIASDLPPSDRRQAQDLLLWLLVEQGRTSEGLEIIQTLHPLGDRAPTERGLAAIAIVQCAASDRKAAETAVKAYQKLFPKGKLAPAVQLAWGRHLGALGEARPAAEVLRKLLREAPKGPEADEARLALATLISEGKLPAKIAKAFPDPAQLLKEMGTVDPTGDLGRRRIMVRLRMALRESRWQEAMDHAQALKESKHQGEDAVAIRALREDAFRAYTRDHLEKKQPGALLPYLTQDMVGALSHETRLALCGALARVGLAEAAITVQAFSPESERPRLRQAILEATLPETDSDATLKLTSPKGSPTDLLRRAQAEATRQQWSAVAALVPRAKPGAERVQLLLALLRRPTAKESKAARLREGESWLSRAPEKGQDREPLAVLVADLRAQQGDWKGALALYPEKPRPELKGWVALMRATALIQLGRPEQAKAILQAHVDEPAFKMERQTLGKQVGL